MYESRSHPPLGSKDGEHRGDYYRWYPDVGAHRVVFEVVR